MTLSERVAAHLALEKRATPGPWSAHEALGSVYAASTGRLIADIHLGVGNRVVNTATFIAASHDACDILREQAAEIERLRGALTRIIYPSHDDFDRFGVETPVVIAREALEQQP